MLHLFGQSWCPYFLTPPLSFSNWARLLWRQLNSKSGNCSKPCMLLNFYPFICWCVLISWGVVRHVTTCYLWLRIVRVMRKQDATLWLVTRWHCWSMFGKQGDIKQDRCVLCTAACAPDQHVLAACIPPLSIIILSFSPQPLSPYSQCECVHACACVNDDSECNIWHCPKERWWKPGWKAQHSLKSDLSW